MRLVHYNPIHWTTFNIDFNALFCGYLIFIQN